MEAVTPTAPAEIPRKRGPVQRGRRRRAISIAFLLMTAVATAGVQLVASDGTPYSWDLDTPQPNVVAGNVTYFVGSNGTADIVSGPISDISAVHAGIDVWEIGSTRIRFTEDRMRRASGKNALDRVNYVGWVNSGMSRLTLAVTIPTRSGTDILDMDVLFNDRDYEWDTPTPGIRGVADIQAIMAHEWGHALGLDHVPLRTSTMYFSSVTGATAYRSLSPDDTAIVGSLYPNDTFRQTTGTLRGSVTRFGASNHRAIHVVAVSLVTNTPAASTLTNPDGSYEMKGLPRGAYRLIAAPTVPLAGAMNSYWSSGSTAFLPSVLGTSGGNPAPAASVWVQPDAITNVPAFEVRADATPFEPNASLGQSKLVDLGDAVVARLESGGDEDWYAFDATVGQKVTVSVLAWHIGSKADPALTLTGANGVPIKSESDSRPERVFETRIEGPDLDARLVGVEIPSTGRYFVKVRNETAGVRDDNFYVLFIAPASDAPSAALTSVEATPSRLDADGTSTATLTITPREETGDAIGAGADVTLMHDGQGTAPSVATDLGDGRYTATITAPLEPGRDRFTITVATDDGIAVLSDSAVLVYLGPGDGTKSEVEVRPRRIAGDGMSQAVVELLPRDAQGESLGPGRSVSLHIAGVTGTTAATSTDGGGGSYETVITAGGASGEASISATVDQVDLGPVAALHIGFDLAEVNEQARIDAEAFLLIAGLKKKAASALRGAIKKADGTADALLGGNTKRAISRTRKVLAKFVRAEKKAKGHLPALGTTAELAQAIRELAASLIETAAVTTGKEQRALDDANDALQEGDAYLIDGDDPKKAASRYEKAYKWALRLQP